MGQPDNTKIAKVLAVVIGATAVLVMAGWAFDIVFLKSISPDWIAMRPTTAVNFMLTAFILYYIAEDMEGRIGAAGVVLPLASSICAVFMLSLLYSNLFGTRTELENLFVVGMGGKPLVLGRPALPAIFNFILVAMSGMATVFRAVHLKFILAWLGGIITASGAVSCAGYLLNVPLLYFRFDGLDTVMAFHTSLLFVLFGAGLLVLSREIKASSQADNAAGIKSPVRLLTTLVFLLFITEMTVMVILAALPPMPAWYEALIDAATMSALFFPIFYFLVFRPFKLRDEQQTLAQQQIRQSQQELHDSEEKFRQISATAADAIVMMDNSGKVSFWNAAAERIFGYSAQEALGKEVHSFIAPERNHAAFAANFSVFQETGQGPVVGKPLELQGVRKDGVEISLELTVSSVQLHGQWHAVGIARDITARKQMELRLKESEERFRSIYEGSNDAIMLSGREGFIDCNAHALEMFGLESKKEIIGAHPAQLSPPVQPDGSDSFSLANEKRAEAFERGSNRFEWMCRRKNGEDFPVEVLLSAFDFSGEKILQATVRDITERKAAEEKLLRSRASLRAIMDNSPYMIWLKDTDGRYLAANMEFLKATGRAHLNEVIGRTDFDLWPQELAEKFSADDAEVMSARRQKLFEEYAVNSEGRISWVETLKTPVVDKNGQLLGTTGFARDTSERRRMEDEIRHDASLFEALLRINEQGSMLPEKELLSFGLDCAEQLTASRIAFLHFVSSEGEAIELTACSEAAEAYCDAPDGGDYTIAQAGAWADCLYGRQALVLNEYAGYEGRRELPGSRFALRRLVCVPIIEGGKVRAVICVGDKLADYDDGDVKTVQLIGNDLWRISRRQRSANELKANLEQQRLLNKKLEEAQSHLLQSEKMAALGQLAAGVAHELNNPLGFVNSNFGILENYLNDIFAINAAYESASADGDHAAGIERFMQIKQEKDYDYIKKDIFQLVEESKEGVSRMRKIVQDLKSFSRVGEEGWQWSDLHKGLESTLNIVWNELKYKCTVVKEYGELPEVYCMPPQLNQVFMNLLINASQAIAEKGTITIRTGVQDKEVWVEVEDTGKGIPPEHINRIFEPFFTTKPVGVGTGLGLSLSYNIVQKHSGRIEVDSTPGKGTRMRVWLPVKPELPGDAGTAA